MLGGSWGSIDGKVLGSDVVIKMGPFDGEVFGTILVNVDRITLELDFGTELGSLDEYFDVSNDVNIEGLLLGESLISTDGKVFGSDKGTKLGSNDGNVNCTIIGNIYVITLGLDVGTELGSLYGSCDGFNDGKFEGLLFGDLLG